MINLDKTVANTVSISMGGGIRQPLPVNKFTVVVFGRQERLELMQHWH